MIAKIIELSVRNRFVVLVSVAAMSAIGIWALYRTPVDAIPDLSENQVIVWTDWMGRSPKEVEDQVTYPLSVNLQGLAGVRDVRSTSEFGFSMINVIFDDSVDFYFARQRVLERLAIAATYLPPGVTPYLAPDATALGQIFWYTVEGDGKSLEELRSIQDWYVRYQLNAVPGVAQVSSVGGFVREYQVDVDPNRLRAREVTLGQLYSALQRANSAVGGSVIHKGGSEYLVRGIGWIRGLEDISRVVIESRGGVPIRVEDVATVQLGPQLRRSVLAKNGREAVGGVVMMRFGENPLEVTRRVKQKIVALQPGLPAGVRIVPFYDRTPLIEGAIATLRRTLIEEILIASLAVLVVLTHVRSSFVICATLPLSILFSFILMRVFGIPSNIMSLSGIAISIGVLIDAGIVITENAYTRLQQKFGDGKVTGDTRDVVIEACQAVGSPVFFSVVIMLVSFLPVFALSGMEGRMFHPLAFTKTFALLGVSLIAITAVPALIPTFVRGRLRREENNWLVASVISVYRPVLTWLFARPGLVVFLMAATGLAAIGFVDANVFFSGALDTRTFFLGAVAVVVVAASFFVRTWPRRLLTFGLLLALALTSWRFPKIGGEFMPPLDEGSILDMPVTRPSANVTEGASGLLARDGWLRSFPEVHQVVGKAGRADTPTDPSPVDMIETIITLKPRDAWPRRAVAFEEVEREAREVGRRVEAAAGGNLDDAAVNAAAMDAAARFDRILREHATRRFREAVPEMGRALVGVVVDALARRAGRPLDAGVEAVARARGEALVEAPSEEEVRAAAADLLSAAGATLPPDDPGMLESALAFVRSAAGSERRSFHERLLGQVEARRDGLWEERARALNWELEDMAPGVLVGVLAEELSRQGHTARLLPRELTEPELQGVRAALEPEVRKRLRLERKEKAAIVREMDSEIQVPGWTNIWTQPIINRIDMLATGVRTMIGVKLFGPDTRDLDRMQGIAAEIAEVLRKVPGAVDVTPDQIVGENYLEIEVDREKAARYGVNVEDVQEAIEVALGGKVITMTVEGRQRFPVRLRYTRDWREDEEKVSGVLVNAMAPGDGMPAAQIPISMVADVRVVSGPSMIKTDNGLLRSYIQLNVRDRDIVSFVEEAKRAVEEKIVPRLPPGYFIEWSGQFEHQQRAARTLRVVLPLVLLIIVVILYLTFHRAADALIMLTAVPGALAGGVFAQVIAGSNFSVAVWVGYTICFGLAGSTAIVMLTYLRESIERRGGLAAMKSEAEIEQAVLEGAVHRLRPKLMTEATTIIGLVPMLLASGVGAEIMRPMAAPVLGGILVADEVIDLFIPVLFAWVRKREWRALQNP